MSIFFLVEAELDDLGPVRARICTPVERGDQSLPDHELSRGSVLYLPELRALVQIAEVRLVMHTGPGPDDWLPLERIVLNNGRLRSVDEDGVPNDALLSVARLR